MARYKNIVNPIPKNLNIINKIIAPSISISCQYISLILKLLTFKDINLMLEIINNEKIILIETKINGEHKNSDIIVFSIKQ
jgi:hypothetical protein